ncbi:shufflon system plasmid conjugative transfer pilus tip adhesin PilV [Burkholderia orbicola]|uniref:shufflon system plasmid conjugative transfer pilus tip adhesin PilV n=1 Tax=Burkholderia orbicola TaxID=2978683 RepID=UPI002FDF60C2
MNPDRRSRLRQRGVLSIEAVVVSSLVAFALVGIGGWIKYDADYKNDRAAADNLNLVLQGAQSWFNANTATIAAAANPTVTYPYTTWKGSVSSAVGASNIYGQTYSMRVYKEASGQLDMLVVTTGGSAIPDGSLQRISKMMGGAGGYVSNAQPGLVQNPASGWSLPVANIGGSPGTGHLAAAAFFASAATTNDYLYRHAVSGHPELQQMGAPIDMVNNDINNAGTVNAQKVVVAAGANVQVGSSLMSGDNTNTGIYQNGALYVLHPGGASADIAQVGNVNSSGTVTANGAVVNGSASVNNGNVNVNNGAVVVNNGQVIAGASSWAVTGKSDNWAYVGTDSAGNTNAAKTSAAGSMSINDIQLRSTGQWVSQIEPTTFTQIGWFSTGVTGIGWWKWCGVVGVNGPNNSGGVLPTASNGQGSFYWQVENHSPDSSNILVGCMN